MAHRTFISYKYSEAQDLRNAIIDSLGKDAEYYMGETSESPDLTDTTTENIKNKLKDMMYNTSVTIVILSPHMKESNWIDWEIEYSLKRITRKDRTSRTNGVVGVIQKVNESYDWLKSSKQTKTVIPQRFIKQRNCTILSITIDSTKLTKNTVVTNANLIIDLQVHTYLLLQNRNFSTILKSTLKMLIKKAKTTAKDINW